MSIFSSILNKIFHPAGAAQAATPAGSDQAPAADATPAAAPAGAPPAGGGSAPAPGQEVDVESVLEGIAAQKGGGGNWRTSIVDLMTLLGLDSSLKNRQELAKELGYTGDVNDTAPMNIWLHKQVMTKLAANGGKVPDDLKD